MGCDMKGSRGLARLCRLEKDFLVRTFADRNARRTIRAHALLPLARDVEWAGLLFSLPSIASRESACELVARATSFVPPS